MSTVEEVARTVVATVDVSGGYLLAAKWVADRYQELCSRSRFRHLRRIGELSLPADVAAGTVTATRGLRIVAGNATAAAAWTNALIGWHFRARTTWYEIEGVSGTSLTLRSEYAEDTLTAGSYRIVQRYTYLDPAVRWLGDFLHMRRRQPITRTSLAELDMLHPSRQRVSVGPLLYAEVGEGINPSGARAKQVELYPYCDNDELIHYVYWSEPPILRLDETLPASIDSYTLKEGALIDAMRMKMTEADKAGNVERTAFWRNEYRAQKTSWEQYILNAIRTDRGSDDVSFIMQSAGYAAASSDIVTARDQVIANWPR